MTAVSKVLLSVSVARRSSTSMEAQSSGGYSRSMFVLLQLAQASLGLGVSDFSGRSTSTINTLVSLLGFEAAASVVLKIVIFIDKSR